MLWSQKIVIFLCQMICSYGQLAKIQKFYLSLRLWSNRERLLAFQLLNSRESKFEDICGDKCLGIIISLLKKNTYIWRHNIIVPSMPLVLLYPYIPNFGWRRELRGVRRVGLGFHLLVSCQYLRRRYHMERENK
jgi:hypothetical protein